MNERTTYEQLIARKLEQLPLPDFSNVIWENLQKQLDADMPVSDNIPAKPLVGKNLLLKACFAIITAIILTVLLFLWVKKPLIKEKIKMSAPVKKEQVLQKTNEEKTEEQHIPPFRSIENKPKSISLIKHPAALIPLVDSAALMRDSLSNHTISTRKPVISKPSLDTSTYKNPEIKEITDDDYRLIPERKRKKQ
ncbi:MAG: hypothetical protein WBP45_13675 [Daejeonella sp.]